MSVAVEILDGPLPDRPPQRWAGAGAIVAFEGIVRELEQGRPLDALDYQVYEPMAGRVLARIGELVAARHGLIAMHIAHSRGRVRVGDVSFRLVVAAPHRKEALGAIDEFIDRLKRDVPIWKRPLWRPAGHAAPSSESAAGR
jgi:molybdopterin synthase catalytic subunit